MASITDINYIQIPFRCTQTVDKSLTKAIWIIYIILSQEQTQRAPPIRFGTLMKFKLFFKNRSGRQRPIRVDTDDT